MTKKPRLLWVGDAVVSTGFARCTHETLKAFHPDWDVVVLGLNYMGDPHPHPYPIYPCWSGGDAFGVRRIKSLVSELKPDAIVIQNDPWNIGVYLQQLKDFDVPVIAALAVDGKNCATARVLNKLSLAIFWTKFGLEEARIGGFEGDAVVCPLGIDLSVFKPTGTKVAARKALGLPERTGEAWIVGNVNRNQPRKRLDLTIEYFCEWVRRDHPDAYLYLHIAPTGEQGYDAQQLMDYYGCPDRLILAEPDMGYGASERHVVATYNAFDVQISTTQGEGWGLTTMEGMACGIPQIFPDWSALGEWATKAGYAVPCTSTAVTPNKVNVIGGIPDKKEFVTALAAVHNEAQLRVDMRRAGLEIAADPRYDWTNIARDFREAVESVVKEKEVERAS